MQHASVNYNPALLYEQNLISEKRCMLKVLITAVPSNNVVQHFFAFFIQLKHPPTKQRHLEAMCLPYAIVSVCDMV
jgi:hypothetical protein